MPCTWGRIQIMTTPSESTEPAEKPTTYRGPGAIIGGVIVLAFTLAGSIDLLVEEGAKDIVGAAIMLVVASLAFAYGVYPAAYSGRDSLVVRNPLRTITLPWGIVTKLAAQLSFIAFTSDTKFTVWAVPVSLRERRRAERNRLREMARQNRSPHEERLSRSFNAAFRPNASNTPRADPIERQAYCDQALTEMNGRRDVWLDHAGLTRDDAPTGDVQPTVAWNPTTLVPIAATVVFLIIALIVH